MNRIEEIEQFVLYSTIPPTLTEIANHLGITPHNAQVVIAAQRRRSRNDPLASVKSIVCYRDESAPGPRPVYRYGLPEIHDDRLADSLERREAEVGAKLGGMAADIEQRDPASPLVTILRGAEAMVEALI